VFVHLRSRCQHVEDCSEDRCAPKCGFRRFDETLAAPLMPWEVREQQRIDERARELLAGRIPGVAVPAAPEPAAEVVPGEGDAVEHTG
jgi:hypothetical protein